MQSADPHFVQGNPWIAQIHAAHKHIIPNTLQVNKHPLSNARSRKNELKEVLPAILPGYIQQLVAPLLSGMEAYLLQVIENEDETSSVVQSPQSWEVGLKEENIPSEGKKKGESHGSHTQPQYDVTSLKEALVWINLMQRNLPQTIGQMSPEERLFFVQSVYSLNTALMVNQSLQQLQQSPVIPELAALLLGMGQPQPCQYEELCGHDYFPPIVNALSSTLAKHEIHFVDNPHVMEAIQALEAFPVLEESGSEDQQLSLDVMCPKFDKELSSDIIISHFAAISPERKKVLDRRPLKKLLGEKRDGYKFTGSFHTPGIFFDDRSDQEDLRKNLIPPTCTFTGFLEEKYVEAIAQESIPTEATSCMKYNSSLSSALDTEPKGVEKSLNKYCSTAATESEAEVFAESKCDTKELPPAPLNTCPKNDIPLPDHSPTQWCWKTRLKRLRPDHSPTQWCWKTRLKRLSLKNIRYYLCRASQHSLEELDTECHETICHAVVSIPFTHEEAVLLLRILKSKELNVFTSCDKYGNVPLHIAVMKSNTEIVRELIRICPAAVKMTNHNGATPVDLAFGMRHSDIMDCLLNRAIEDDHTDLENLRLLQSLLPRAMKNGYTDYLRILLKLQSQYSLAIDFNCTDSDHRTAAFYLQQQPPHVQEAVGTILNNSSNDPEVQSRIRMHLFKTVQRTCTCLTMEPEQATLSSLNHSEDSTSEEQPLPHLHSVLLKNLFPSDEGSDYSEDDDHVCVKMTQHKRRFSTRSCSVKSRHQNSNGRSVFQPVGSGSSSSDDSTTFEKVSLSWRERERRKHAANRIQSCRFSSSESESQGKETNCRRRYHQVLSKPKYAEDDSSASDTEPNSLIKLSDRDNTQKSETTCIATLKAKGEVSWPQSSDMQLSVLDASSQVYTHPLQCTTDDLLQVLEQPELPMVTDNHQVKDRLDSSEILPMTECEKNYQTPEVLGEAIRTKAQSEQATWQTQNFQVTSPPETEQGESEECETREQKDRQSAAQESLEGFSQHIILRMMVPVLQQNAWPPLPKIVPCVRNEHETLQPVVSREEKSSVEQQDSNCITLRTQQHSTSKQSVSAQPKTVLNLRKQYLMLHQCSPPKYSCQPTCPTEGLEHSIVLQSEQVEPITACDSKKSSKHCSFDRANFRYIITELIRDYSFTMLRRVVPHDLHFLFGLSPWRGQPLSRLQKKQFSEVLKVARCNRSAIPADVKQNLDDLAMALAMACASVPEVTIGDVFRGGGGEKKSSKGAPMGKASKQSKTQKETAATKTVDASQTADSGVFSLLGAKSKGTNAITKLFGTKHDSSSKALSDQQEKYLPSNTQVAHSLNPQDKEKGKSNTEIEEWEPLVQQKSTDRGVLHFANSNHPVNVHVLQDHFTTYSKCCPRHDIQNIVVIASTCPASEALGPKRRYSSIKDLLKEDRHSQLNLSSSLSREDRSGTVKPSLSSTPTKIPNQRSKGVSSSGRCVQWNDRSDTEIENHDCFLLPPNNHLSLPQSMLQHSLGVEMNFDPPSKAISDQHDAHLPQVAHCLPYVNPQNRDKLKRRKSNNQMHECKPQLSTNSDVLHFSNSNHPLEVLRDHFTTYSKCCPRHDIQNIVVIASTCPASEALGPKRRYSSIKDLRKEDRHSQLNLSSSLSREDRSGATQPLPQQNQTMIADSPVTATRHKEVSMVTVATETAAGTMPGPTPKPTLTAEGAPSLSQRLIERGPFHTHDQGLQAVGSNHGNNADSHSHHPFLQPLSSWHPCSAPPSSRTFCDISQYSLSVAEQREHKDRIRTAAELLHAQDYQRIFSLAYEGRLPPNLPPETHVAYVFITGLAYYKLRNNKDSLSYFQQCLRLAEEYGREGDVTLSCIYIGDIEFAQRNYLAASKQYQRALHRYSRDTVARDFRMILPTQSALCAKRGSALKNASKVVDAIAAYEEAIARAESKKDKLSAHISLGNLFQSVGENARAVTEYEHSIQLATDLQDFVSLGWAHGNMGNAYLGLYQRDKALHHLEKSLDLAVEHEPTPQAIGRAYNNLGTAYQSLGELEKAEEYYDLSLSQAIYGNDIPGQARVYGNIGNLLMIKKECDRAVPHYTEVLRLSQDKSTVSTARHNRGCAYYEWAESKKKNFLQRGAPSTAPTATKPLFHGPQFEDCEPENRPPFIPKNIEKYYVQGTKDLDFVIKHHEESLHSIKGLPKGLNLSVSLFETNSRTFHQKQDCLVNMGKFEEALLTAEQSRARTLGELLLKRRGPQLEQQLTSPPSLEQLKAVVARQDCPVVYLSYTGARLLGWVFCPSPSQPSLNMFEVPLSDSEFDGKSFDYHLRYSLNEALVEKSFEMYKPFKYDEDQNNPVLKLYDLVAKPVMTMLRKLKKDAESADHPPKKAQKIIIIPDSYTNLLPMTCLLDRSEGKFWGDDHYFQVMPSLLTMGILDQLPTVSVSVPVEHQQMLCVVGNPTIPMFTYNGEEWNLGKLPHATKEAEWVSHILNCTPILHEQATKSAVMMRLMNAKVIHLATHGSAAAGFLAFAGMSSSFNETVDAKQVLIYPDEIESLSITPALVVLSSCDSGCDIVKADGIQSMAHAFILAGAQAVLTTLWRVPDESACVFMQFFYQYLVDGLRGTEALHKAILSVRCFSKYSQYIHWSGYQLTGREIQFSINRSSSATELTARLGNHSIFPQLEIVKQLETTFLNNPRLPTDVQVLLWCH